MSSDSNDSMKDCDIDESMGSYVLVNGNGNGGSPDEAQPFKPQKQVNTIR